VLSCADAIGKAIERYVASAEREAEVHVATVLDLSPECPECGGMMSVGEGCGVCRQCGYSQCG